MGKVDIEFGAKRGQCPIGCIEQGICGNIIRRPEPFALEDSPQRLRYIQMWTIWRKEKEEQTQYCCDAYVATVKERGIAISMTEDYKPTDNAIAKRVNGPNIPQQVIYDTSQSNI